MLLIDDNDEMNVNFALVDLNHRYKLNQEALSILNKQRSSGDTNKRWVYTGDIFILMKDDHCNRTMLEENTEIEKELKHQESFLKKKEEQLIRVSKDADIEREKFFSTYLNDQQKQEQSSIKQQQQQPQPQPKR
ncbi:hypothetical protein PPL_11926 [Heterostelium album PN500]|uniref:P53 and DNA damage-regulated protein 1 n=1 Tax=Heterostelium pallidum (strain ATCC 26659 / Pp 5 / PN500) TaxID=670386 RepID=D3BUV4_HETP5|nr:hypothetical protein PPL_11926 [Heterostelium album PN500]EFA74892.1 hypothetical protein PPL_11926 [Heterostelium album PN500]|eukprot:XP_020427026.1 hypothetical protein PPL_11926 [Heterostelium album PN500]